MQALCGFLRFLCIFPENARAALRGNDGIHGVLQNPHAVRNRQCKRAAAAAFTDQNRDDRRFQPDHFHKVFGNGLSLPALLCADAAERAGGIHKANHRAMEFLCLLHQAQRLSVALRVRRTEVAVDLILCVCALFDGDDRHRAAAERRDAADDRGVIRKTAVAVQLNEIRENILNEAEAARASLAASKLNLFVCRCHYASASFVSPASACCTQASCLPSLCRRRSRAITSRCRLLGVIRSIKPCSKRNSAR